MVLFWLLFASLGLISEGQREPGSIWIPSPHIGSRDGYSINWLIIHGTAGGSSAEGVAYWFQNPESQAATHYVIGQDGTVVQCVDEGESAWGKMWEAGADPWWSPSDPSPNQTHISIEHVKPNTDNSDLITPAQANASFILVTNILERHPGIRRAWATSEGGITGHFSVAPPSRERCPGPYPWEDLFTFLTGTSDPICLGTVIVDVLNIRALPTTSSIIIDTAPRDRVINFKAKVQGESVGGSSEWYQLFDGSGFVPVSNIRRHIEQPEWC